MPTIKYRISSRVHNGQAEVLARFYDGEVSQRAKTRIPAPVSAWNDEDGCLVIPRKTTPESVTLREIQRKLDELTDMVYNAWWRDQYDVRKGWLQQVIDDFHDIPQKNNKQKCVLLADVVLEYAQSKNLAPRSIAMYAVIASAIGRFEKATKQTIYADSFTDKDVQAFADWLSNADGIVRSRNTMAARLKSLAAVCRFAVQRGYMRCSPFGNGGYKIKREVYGEPVYLTISERNHLTQPTWRSCSEWATLPPFFFSITLRYSESVIIIKIHLEFSIN